MLHHSIYYSHQVQKQALVQGIGKTGFSISVSACLKLECLLM